MFARCSALLLFPTAVCAQPFVELGVGAITGGCLYDARADDVVQVRPRVSVFVPGCSRNALGLAAVGYQISDRWRVQLDHWSSLQDRDRGAEILSIRYHYTFR
jgi:hypothetical protein